MMHASHINPDTELKALLDGQITVGMSGGKTEKVTVYSDWERPTNGLPADFIVIYVNGNIEGVGAKVDYASGYLLVSLYSKLNADGSVKANRVTTILDQFDTAAEGDSTEHYFYRYDMDRFSTPTSPNQTSGYPASSLNLRWHTKNNFNKQ